MSMFVINKDFCSGCELCKNICPTNAIEFKENTEGFSYPIKNSNCINCGLCTKKCPMINEIEVNDNIEQEVFCARHKEKNIVEKSTSGGAFSAIAQIFCDSNYIIFGAKYNENNDVEHDFIDSIEKIDIFRKSKYVQSNIKNSYKKAKEFLDEGKKVLFSGTPCQIGALKKFLAKDYENLLCIDIICHGAPSPKVFKIYKDFIKNKNKSEIEKIEFKHKSEKIDNSRNIFIKLKNGKEILKNNKEDLYLNCFYNKLIYRTSCSNCKFANPVRYSDITLGDAWGIEKIYPDLNVHKGESMIIVNTKKGKKIFENIEKYMNVRKLSIEFAIKENSQFREPTKLNENRELFFEKLDDTKFEKLVDDFCGIKFFSKIKRKIKKISKHRSEKNGRKEKI